MVRAKLWPRRAECGLSVSYASWLRKYARSSSGSMSGRWSVSASRQVRAALASACANSTNDTPTTANNASSVITTSKMTPERRRDKGRGICTLQ